MENLDALESDLLRQIADAATPADLEDIRVGALGKKGNISALMKTLGGMDPEQRKTTGARLNVLRTAIADAIAARGAQMHAAELEQRLQTEKVDVTLPIRPQAEGCIHPVSHVTDEIVAIFADLGFAVAEGPDIEDDFHNFTALNFPEGHPARETHDTFFLHPDASGERKLLRTHTSPVQIRSMMTQKPPLRLIVPGRTYRCDSDQTHTPMFHQFEGLVIDQHTHMGHLKWCLVEFIKAFFEVDDVKFRFRPHFFPFTEPSAEMDIGYTRVGNEIRVGEGDDWLEILGCGMVHPNVLRNVGLDSDVYQGFAFGAGIDRLAMLKYGIPDLRDFFAADIRWLQHYGFAPLDIPNLATGLSS